MEQSKQASRATRDTWALLMEHYDDVGLSYQSGWSDARIAELVGLAETFVAAIRQEHFGPAENPEVENLFGELASVRAQLAEDMKDIRRMAKDIEAAAVAKLDALGTRVAKMRGP